MAEYVEREALAADLRGSYEELRNIYNDLRFDEERRICSAELNSFMECIIRVKNAPAADVVEVRHGHWIESNNLESFNTRGWKRYKKVICSHCKKSNYNNHSNYCPNCGAKMDGKGADPTKIDK